MPARCIIIPYHLTLSGLMKVDAPPTHSPTLPTKKASGPDAAWSLRQVGRPKLWRSQCLGPRNLRAERPV